LLKAKEFSIVAGFACLMAVPASSATTTFYSSDGSGYFLYQDIFYSSALPAPLPQFDPSIAKGSFLQSASIEFSLFSETAGARTCDSQGLARDFDSHVSVSLLGRTYSKGGSVHANCSGPGDSIDFYYTYKIYDYFSFDVSKDDLGQFIGTGIIPILMDFGRDVIRSRLTYEVYYEFEPSPSAVPLPASGWLLMTPLIGLLGARRRNRKRTMSNE
jgi:hypothetical protein